MRRLARARRRRAHADRYCKLRRAPVDRYASLLEIAKLLLTQGDTAGVAETILRRLLDLAGADRGFVVVREDESFEVKIDVHFDRAAATSDERRFSRRLVREVIDSRELFLSQD